MSGIQNSVSSANRVHIGVFGRMNAGKSSLINAFTNQPTAIVSPVPGTTTDVVKKAMEIHGLGPCIIMDTAGIDDTSTLGDQRIKATLHAMEQCDLAILLFYDEDISFEKEYLSRLKDKKIPVCGVLAHSDLFTSEEREERIAKLESELGIPMIACSSKSGWGLPVLRDTLIRLYQGKPASSISLTGDLVHEGDTVVLVMPQDAEAPMGRLIQPQVMAIRDCLDKQCVTICVTVEGLKPALENMKKLPDIIITDSQAFKEVYDLTPEGVKLTSFSILMAALKGDIRYYADSCKAIEDLTEDSKVLIAECCTHAPIEEDIGRVKIPRLLRKKVGEGLSIDVKAGTDFPMDAGEYDLIIQCGGCMFNRRYIMNRINHAKYANVPMTNYGIAIAYLNGILQKVTIPEE